MDLVATHIVKALLAYLLQCESGNPIVEDLKNRDIAIDKLIIPQLHQINITHKSRAAVLQTRTGRFDIDNNPPNHPDYKGDQTSWTTWIGADKKPYAQEPMHANGEKGRYFEIKAKKHVSFNVGVLLGVAGDGGFDASGVKYLMQIMSHKKRPASHASEPGAPGAPRNAGRMCTVFCLGPPHAEGGEFKHEYEFYLDFPKGNELAKWSNADEYLAQYELLSGEGDEPVDGDDEEIPLRSAHEFVFREGKTWIATRRGKDVHNVLCASFQFTKIVQILAFNDRTRSPQYKIVCSLKLDPNAPLQRALLPADAPMASVDEHMYKELEVEVVLEVGKITTQASLNATLGKYHPKLVFFNKNTEVAVELIAQLPAPATQIAVSKIGRQQHDRNLWQFSNGSLLVNYAEKSFVWLTADESSSVFVPSVFTNPMDDKIPPLPMGTIPLICPIPMELCHIAYFICFRIFNQIDTVVFGNNAIGFQIGWAHLVFCSQHVTAFTEGVSSIKNRGAPFLYLFSTEPYTGKTSCARSGISIWGIAEMLAGDLVGTGAAMKRVCGLFNDTPVVFDDIVIGDVSSIEGKRSQHAISQIGRQIYEGTTRSVCGSYTKASGAPAFTGNSALSTDDPALISRALVIEGYAAKSPFEVTNLNFWYRISPVGLPYVLMLNDLIGQIPRDAVIDTMRALIAAVGKDMRQIETWSRAVLYNLQWSALMQRGADHAKEVIQYAVRELSHIAHMEKAQSILEKMIIAIYIVELSKRWDGPPNECVGIHNVLKNVSPNPLAQGEAAQAYYAVNSTSIAQLFANLNIRIDVPTLHRYIRDHARPSGLAILVAKGHTAGNGSPAHFYNNELKPNGERNPWPAVEYQQQELDQAPFTTTVRVPMSQADARAKGLCVQATTIYVKKDHWLSVIQQSSSGMQANPTMEGVMIESMLLGREVEFLQLITSNNSPYYGIAHAHPFSYCCGMRGSLALGHWGDPNATASFVKGANEVSLAQTGLTIEEQWTPEQLSKYVGPHFDLENLPEVLKYCPFVHTPSPGHEPPPSNIFQPFDFEDYEESMEMERCGSGEQSSGQAPKPADDTFVAGGSSPASRIDALVSMPLLSRAIPCVSTTHP